ncbi:glycoside hydrolase family 3 N-terminal domain-containing protein [Anaerophilus nitritogenes]|uniref:glycoside hydrolase family 3 N-terminal domain-containing protein n=1 Tax=Anaerophilus nitritogenes TaxID=2498136 RepID=UPI001FAAB25C|nr:glycoside hydrolase family 3 N-terminal domain-containing protein [Anaerophilus nitritogenes]
MKIFHIKYIKIIGTLLCLCMLMTSCKLVFNGTKDSERNKEKIEKVVISDPVEKQMSDLEKAHQILNEMSLEEKVGQMFIVRCPQENAIQSISKYHLGGYILFGRDFKNKTQEEVSLNIQSYQNASKIDMLIGVDEEGGTVNRVSAYNQFRSSRFKSPQNLYKEGGWALIAKDTEEKVTLLKSLGINLNMAPVGDVSTNQDDYMYARTFGKDAKLTSQYVQKVVGVMNNNKLGCVLKHFPGYGDNLDTHTGMAYDYRSYESFVKNDFLPFISGIKAGADAILVSHNIVDCMDSQYPASLSAKVHQILRKDLSFDGVIITDDLYMDAIQKYTKAEEAAVVAVLAGNDMICCTDFDVQIPAVIEAVKNEIISEDTIDQSVIRILCWKLILDIIE